MILILYSVNNLLKINDLRGGRYWTRTSDLVRVKHAL